MLHTRYPFAQAGEPPATTGGRCISAAARGIQVLSVHPGPIATDMGDDAGFSEVAEPPTKVAEGIVAALRSGDFHHFPDSMAQQIGQAYQSFAENVIEADLVEA